MKLLAAEDNIHFRKVFEQVLARDYDLILTQDSNEAWARLQQDDAPQLAILDWFMPGLCGPEICRRVRRSSRLQCTYLILLTARNSAVDVVSGLRAGADDYISKPFQPEELRSRRSVGKRIVDLQQSLAEQSAKLNKSLEREKQFQELLHGDPSGGAPLASQRGRSRPDHFNFELAMGFLENAS